jgi:hypothetical protein
VLPRGASSRWNILSGKVGRLRQQRTVRPHEMPLPNYLAKSSLIQREAMRSNLSIDADPQQQDAASPLMLVVRSFSR